MRLVDSLPSLAAELQQLLNDANEPMIAVQINQLSIVDRCRCNDDFCSSFYTAQKPIGSWGPNHRNISLSPARGMIILDLVEEKLMYIEILDRDEVRSQLGDLFP